jgi:uncharacterized protein YjhX (UPF0386 family)
MATNILLAWNPLPFPQGTNAYAADLSDPASVVRLFKQASRFRAHITAQGWRFLWTRFGKQALLEINQQAGWIDGDHDLEVIEQLTSRSLIAGYDPVSERFRGYFERIESLELTAN